MRDGFDVINFICHFLSRVVWVRLIFIRYLIFYTDFRGLCRHAEIGNAIDIISKIKMSKCVRIEVLEVTGLGWACHAQIVYDFYL